MCKYLFMLLLLSCANVFAVDTFDATRNILRISAVAVYGKQYDSVTLRLVAYDVVSVASSAPYAPASDCGYSSLESIISDYHAIWQGMKKSAVMAILGSCYTDIGSNGYRWDYPGTTSIWVYFDENDDVKTMSMGTARDKIASFDKASGILNLSAVVVDGVLYTKVVLRLKDYQVLKVGASGRNPYVEVADTCSSKHIILARYEDITAGMSVDEVNEALGCKYVKYLTTTSYYVSHGWTDKISIIIVFFDAKDKVVTPPIAGGAFKVKMGF